MVSLIQVMKIHKACVFEISEMDFVTIMFYRKIPKFYEKSLRKRLKLSEKKFRSSLDFIQMYGKLFCFICVESAEESQF